MIRIAALFCLLAGAAAARAPAYFAAPGHALTVRAAQERPGAAPALPTGCCRLPVAP